MGFSQITWIVVVLLEPRAQSLKPNSMLGVNAATDSVSRFNESCLAPNIGLENSCERRAPSCEPNQARLGGAKVNEVSRTAKAEQRTAFPRMIFDN